MDRESLLARLLDHERRLQPGADSVGKPETLRLVGDTISYLQSETAAIVQTLPLTPQPPSVTTSTHRLTELAEDARNQIEPLIYERTPSAVPISLGGQHVLVPLEPPASIPRQGYDEVLFQHCRDDDYEGLYREMVKRAALSSTLSSAPAMTDEELAFLFHSTYERLASEHDYVTRLETRAFDPRSRNGQLMIAVVRELRGRLVSASGLIRPATCPIDAACLPDKGRCTCVIRATDSGSCPKS